LFCSQTINVPCSFFLLALAISFSTTLLILLLFLQAMGGAANCEWLAAAKKNTPTDGNDWASCMLLGAYE
jgi:hypothetical protein